MVNDYLNKYKNTVIKLQHVGNFSEVTGQLNDIYDDGFIKITKPIITADRAFFNFSSIMSDIIKLNQTDENGSTLTVPLAPIYNNDGTNNSIILNIKDFVFVPLYEPKIFDLPDNIIEASENLTKQKTMSKLVADYIDYVYDEYNKMTQVLTGVSDNKNEQQ